MSGSAAFGFSRRAHRATEQPISFLMAEALRNPELISLAAGFVDYDTLPHDTAARLLGGLLDDAASARAALQYGTTQGLPALRAALFAHLARLDGVPEADLPGSPEDLVVTTGSQQMLHLLADLLVDEGDIVITGWPSYFVYTGALSAFGAAVRSVDLDEFGMPPERLDALLAELHTAGQLPRVKIVYVCSYHQNPTGITLAADRRAALLDVVRKWSRSHRILLIEDAAYRELEYDGVSTVDSGASAPSLKRFDTGNEFVALLQTFSKPFAPGLKTGYGLMPRDLVEPVVLAKGGRDFGSANLCQHLLHAAVVGGAFDRHIATLREAYRVKRDAMLAALDRCFGPLQRSDIRWTRPAGGLYVWLTLPEPVDTGRHGPLFGHAVREGVLFVPGEYCYPPDPTRTIPRNTIRLSFGVPTVAKIEEGVERLARAVVAVLWPDKPGG